MFTCVQKAGAPTPRSLLAVLCWLFGFLSVARAIYTLLNPQQVADLVDKLGRAVLQRDENIREKSKAQAAESGVRV